MTINVNYNHLSLMVGWFARNSAAVSICSALCLFCITYGGLGVLWAASVCTYSLILLSVLRAAYAVRLTGLISQCFTQYKVLLTLLAGMSVMKTTVDYVHKRKPLKSFQDFSTKANQTLGSITDSKHFHILCEILITFLTHLLVTYATHGSFTFSGFVLHLIDYSANATFWISMQLLPVAAPVCVVTTMLLFSLVKDSRTNILIGSMTATGTLGLYLGIFNMPYALTLISYITSLPIYTGLVCGGCTLLASAFLINPLISNYYKDDCSKPLSALLVAPLYLLVFSRENLILLANALDLVLAPYNGILCLITLAIFVGVTAKIVSDRIMTPSVKPLCYHDFNENSRFGKLQLILLNTLMYASVYAVTFRKHLPINMETIKRSYLLLTDFFEPYCKSISILSATSFGVVLASDLLKPNVSKTGTNETSLLRQLLFARNTPDNVATTSSEVTYKL